VPARSPHRRGALAAVIAVAALSAVWALGAVLGTGGPQDAPVAGGYAVFERAGGSAVSIRVPDGFVAVATGHRVALRTPDGTGRIVLSAPDGVVDPAAGPVALPADPVQWLQEHPRLEVVSARSFRAGGGWGTNGWRGFDGRTADFALADTSPSGAVLGRFTTVPLFCDSAEPGCSRVSAQVQVRVTFIGGPSTARPVLVAAYWPRGGDGIDAGMPQVVRVAYRSVLADLARQTVRQPASQAG
jgi:hypothetical protein